MDRSIKCGVPFGKGGGVVLSHHFGVGDESAEAAVEISLIFSRMQDGGSRPVARLRQWLRWTGGGNVQKGETPTLFWERLEIRLDEDLDGLVAVINLDENRYVAKGHLVATSVLPSNDGVGHCGLV
jgi:hypothetical protein